MDETDQGSPWWQKVLWGVGLTIAGGLLLKQVFSTDSQAIDRIDRDRIDPETRRQLMAAALRVGSDYSATPAQKQRAHALWVALEDPKGRLEPLAPEGDPLRALQLPFPSNEELMKASANFIASEEQRIQALLHQCPEGAIVAARQRCPMCQGAGSWLCPRCQGRGMEEAWTSVSSPDLRVYGRAQHHYPCTNCQGSGQQRCRLCSGTGRCS